MREILEGLEKSEKVSWLLDTCFLIHEFDRGRVKELEKFCKSERVGMSSFNLLELEHVPRLSFLGGPLDTGADRTISRTVADGFDEIGVDNREL